jgi:phospholipid transport system substrate-binding protein
MLKHSYHARLSVWHLVLLVIILAISLPALARPADATPTDRVPSEPTRLLMQTSQEMLAALRQFQPVLKDNPHYILTIVNEILTPHVDMQTAARQALGKHWRTASPQQRQRFTAEFRTLLLRFYSLSLVEYLNLNDLPPDVIRFQTDIRPANPLHTVVQTRVQPAWGRGVAVNYAVHRVGREWKVFDVSVDGISIVSAYRSVFQSELRKTGVDGLIAILASQNRKLLNG